MLSFILQTDPFVRGGARQSGNKPVSAEPAWLSSWLSIFLINDEISMLAISLTKLAHSLQILVGSMGCFWPF